MRPRASTRRNFRSRDSFGMRRARKFAGCFDGELGAGGRAGGRAADQRSHAGTGREAGGRTGGVQEGASYERRREGRNGALR